METIHDIENATSLALKEGRKEAIKIARDSEDVAERYVQARLDATFRDEKLAEQGVTISALQDSLGVVKVALDEAMAARAYLVKRSEVLELDRKTEVEKAAVELKSTSDTFDALVATLRKENDAIQARLGEADERSLRLSIEAKRNNTALNNAASVLNAAISSNLVDAADKG